MPSDEMTAIETNSISEWRRVARRVAVLSIPLALILACGASVRASFTPYSATSVQPQIVGAAVMYYAGDAQTLAQAGAIMIGSIQEDGNRFANQGDLATKAAAIAAQYGGTHFTLYQAGVNYGVDVTPAHVNTTYTQNGSYTTYNPGSTNTYTMPAGSFLVVRVPPENWGMLPPQLRPLVPNQPQPAVMQVNQGVIQQQQAVPPQPIIMEQPSQ